MNSSALNVRQISQYPQITGTAPTDMAIVQQGGLGGPYASITVTDMVGNALAQGGALSLDPNGGVINFGQSTIQGDGYRFYFSGPIISPLVNGIRVTVGPDGGRDVATKDDLAAGLASVSNVSSFMGRTGNIILTDDDIRRGGGAPIIDAHFGGWITAPSPWDVTQSDDTVATTKWTQSAMCNFMTEWLDLQNVVYTFNTRAGNVVLATADVNAAYYTADGVNPLAPTPPLGDVSDRIATTQWAYNTGQALVDALRDYLSGIVLPTYAPLDSPNFTGVPTAPTANPGTSTGQLATTAYVENAIVASTTGVSSFNTRTGAVTLLAADITAAGGALLNSPVFVGVPQAPTAAPGSNNQQLATTAFVQSVASGVVGVTSWNTRTGAVTLTLADITAAQGAPINNPAFLGAPTAPTPLVTDDSTRVATTAYVRAAIAANPTGVTTFNGRAGAVSLLPNDISGAGGALIASPTFVGNPQGPTRAPGDDTTSLATTAFVQTAVASATAGVQSFNGRSGVVTLELADITGAGGAPIASPNLTGVPTAPTAASAAQQDTQIANTQWVGTSFLPIAGGTLTGNLAIAAQVGGASLNLNKPASGVTSQIVGSTAGSNRWVLQLGTSLAESGTSTGSDLGVYRYDNTGTFIDAPFQIRRADGVANFAAIPTAPSAQAGDDSGQLATTHFVTSAIGSAPSADRGNRVFLASFDVTDPVGTVTFLQGFDGTYDLLEVDIWDLLANSESNLDMRVTTNGTTWDAGNNYTYAYSYLYAVGTSQTIIGSGSGQYFQLGSFGPTVAAQNFFRISIRRPAVGGGARFSYIQDSNWQSGTGLYFAKGGGSYNPNANPVLGIQFFYSGATFTRGSFRLYGIVK